MANPSRSGLRWTEEEASILKQLWPRRDVTEEDICKALKRTPKSISLKARQLKLASRYEALAEDINRDYLKRLMEVVEG